MRKNRIVAVSGGVDSVVLLHMLVSQQSPDRLLVAHVNHGIRQEAGEDARFVEALAKQYRLPYLSTSLHLGLDTSEDSARLGRYDFLFEQARKYKASIVTAHHMDDMLGSMAINIARGTGYKGLAVMNRAGIDRPLLSLSKQQLYEYALKHGLEWVEDKTNHQDIYLRNRMRAGVLALSTEAKKELADIRSKQLQLVKEIEQEAERALQNSHGSRYFYTQIDPSVAVVLLRKEVQEAVGEAPMRPHAERLLLAIKTAKPGSRHDISGKAYVVFTKDSFVVHMREQ